jgi:hypothetical protein
VAQPAAREELLDGLVGGARPGAHELAEAALGGPQFGAYRRHIHGGHRVEHRLGTGRRADPASSASRTGFEAPPQRRHEQLLMRLPLIWTVADQRL